jgi:hypothetical protein
MELDDLKTAWQENANGSQNLESERQRVMTIISGSRRSILRSFTIDIIVGIALNLSFAIVLIMFGSHVMPFLYKLMIGANLISLPIYYKLYKSTIYLKHLDFGQDMKANLETFLDYYRGTLRFYKRSTYLLIAALLLLFFLDDSFLQLDLWIKVAVVAYLGIFAVGIGWLIDRLYGRRISQIESYLQNSAG